MSFENAHLKENGYKECRSKKRRNFDFSRIPISEQMNLYMLIKKKNFLKKLSFE